MANKDRDLIYTIKLIFFISVILSVSSSCIPQKKLLLMQFEELNDTTYANDFVKGGVEDSVYRIQSNDYLYINITSVDKKISDFFAPVAGVNYLNSENQALVGYHVEDDGSIEFPYLGPIFLGGLTLRQATDTIRKYSSSVIQDARVEVNLINNTVSVLGEVSKEGSYNMTKHKITIYEAFTLAGGLTDYAKRQKIKVLRTENGDKKVYVVDVTSGHLISKNMFYIYPNDLIYVEPMRAKGIGLTPTFSLSILTTLLTTYVLINSLSK